MSAIPTEKPSFGVLDDVKVVFAAMEEAIPRACNIMADWAPTSRGSRTPATATPCAMRRTPPRPSAATAARRAQPVHARGKEVLLRMLKDTDIFFESSKGGTWERKGFTTRTCGP